MSVLSDIKAALEAKQEAYAAGREIRRVGGAWWVAKEAETATARRLAALLTDDTIAALIATVEWPRNNNEACVCGKVWRFESHAHAFNCPIAPLVKEEADERA